jgi:uncharacterized protein YegP (UPF0339 family)
MRTPRFETFEDEAGSYRWRLIGGNGEIIAGGESYTRREDAERGAQTVISTVLELEAETWNGVEVHSA